MKITRCITLSSIILAMSANVFAQDIKCPPTELIKKIVFQSAKNSGANTWELTSNHFNYEGNQFNVGMQLYDIITANNEVIALAKGQHFFKQAALYAEPYQTHPDTDSGKQYIHCKYWEGQNGYHVQATTPAYPY